MQAKLINIIKNVLYDIQLKYVYSPHIKNRNDII